MISPGLPLTRRGDIGLSNAFAVMSIFSMRWTDGAHIFVQPHMNSFKIGAEPILAVALVLDKGGHCTRL